LVNLSLAHTQADLIRAVLEGVAFSLRTALEVIKEITPVHQLWQQVVERDPDLVTILADVLQTELIAPQSAGRSSLQNSSNGGVGVPNFEAAFKMLQDSDTVQTQTNQCTEVPSSDTKYCMKLLKLFVD